MNGRGREGIMPRRGGEDEGKGGGDIGRRGKFRQKEGGQRGLRGGFGSCYTGNMK